VDHVGDRVALLHRDARDAAGERERDVVERVVVVVADDHAPVAAQLAAGTLDAGELNGLRHGSRIAALRGLGTLSEPAFEAEVELVGRGRLEQRLAVLAGLCAGLLGQRRGERRGVPGGGEVGLTVQLDAQALDLLERVLDRPEVGQAEALRTPAGDDVQ
jgi:hypothetical protein